jgi:hypothetical protein
VEVDEETHLPPAQLEVRHELGFVNETHLRDGLQLDHDGSAECTFIAAAITPPLISSAITALLRVDERRRA